MTGEVIQRPPCMPLVPPGRSELLVRDMTAIFSADVTLRSAQDQLAAHNQWLPIDGGADETLGSLIERNSSGPLRLGFGGWRDLLLGAQFTNGTGELISAGGRTVKNVAGYDLTKIMIGQHAIFGRLVTLTTRTYRLPDGAILARFAPDPTILAGLLPTHLRPQWSLLTRDALLCGYLSDETTLAWYESGVRAKASEVTRHSLQDDTELRAKLWTSGNGPIAFRASVPPAKVKAFVGAIGTSSWIAEPSFGIVLGSVDDESSKNALIKSARESGGRVAFGNDSASLDLSTTAAERQIIERLKTAFDPDNRLQPLPWLRP
jgi:hypothetical protein